MRGEERNRSNGRRKTLSPRLSIVLKRSKEQNPSYERIYIIDLSRNLEVRSRPLCPGTRPPTPPPPQDWVDSPPFATTTSYLPAPSFIRSQRVSIHPTIQHHTSSPTSYPARTNLTSGLPARLAHDPSFSYSKPYGPYAITELGHINRSFLTRTSTSAAVSILASSNPYSIAGAMALKLKAQSTPGYPRILSSHRAFSSSRFWAIASREDRRMIRAVRICCRGRLDAVVEPRCRMRGWEEYPRSVSLGSGDAVWTWVGRGGVLVLKFRSFVDLLCCWGYVSERRRFRVRNLWVRDRVEVALTLPFFVWQWA